jgi:hypothetical protein
MKFPLFSTFTNQDLINCLKLDMASFRALRLRTRSFRICRYPADQSQVARYASLGAFGNIPGMDEEENDEQPKAKQKSGFSRVHPTVFKMLESAATTFASLAVLGTSFLTCVSWTNPFPLDRFHAQYAA